MIMKGISSLLIKDNNGNNLVSLIYPRSQPFCEDSNYKNFTQKVASVLNDLKGQDYKFKNIYIEKHNLFLEYVIVVEKF